MLAGAEEAVYGRSGGKRMRFDQPGGDGMALKSWIASANEPDADFPIQNLPYGVFRHGGQTQIGVAIGDCILDLHACASRGLLAGLSEETRAACRAEWLNPLMRLGPLAWRALRCPTKPSPRRRIA